MHALGFVVLGGNQMRKKRVEDGNREGRRTGRGDELGDIDYACYVSLHWGAGEEKVDLVVGVAEATEVFDAACIL